MVSRRNIYMLSIVAMVSAGGCQERQNMDSATDSFDSPDVLAVVFHPRPERAALVSATKRLGWRPKAGQTVMETPFRHKQKIQSYAGPTLIIHGTHDTIIPLADAEALYQASGSARKQLLRISGAGHNNLMSAGFDEYFQAVADLVRSGGMPPKME